MTVGNIDRTIIDIAQYGDRGIRDATYWMLQLGDDLMALPPGRERAAKLRELHKLQAGLLAAAENTLLASHVEALVHDVNMTIIRNMAPDPAAQRREDRHRREQGWVMQRFGPQAGLWAH